jgi:hypothetical protein
LEFWVPYMRLDKEEAEVNVIAAWGRVVAEIPDYCRELIQALSC